MHSLAAQLVNRPTCSLYHPPTYLEPQFRLNRSSLRILRQQNRRCDCDLSSAFYTSVFLFVFTSVFYLTIPPSLFTTSTASYAHIRAESMTMSTPSASLLLDPKSFRNRNSTGNGNSSPLPFNVNPCTLPIYPFQITHGSPPSSRAISEPPSRETHVQARTQPKAQAMDDSHMPKYISTNTFAKGRSPAGAGNNGAAGAANKGAPLGAAFNPQLLNPRSFRPSKKSPVNTSRSRSAASAAAGGIHDDNNKSESQSPKRTLSEFAGEGQRGMLEDMYGVEIRENTPQKKSKIGDNSSQHKNLNVSRAGDSLLGGYMKEKSGTPQAPVPAPTPTVERDTIDLTLGGHNLFPYSFLSVRIEHCSYISVDNDDPQEENTDGDDDDDVIFISNKDRGAEEVCYGRLEGAMVLAYMVPTPTASIFNGTSPDWPSIRCYIIRQRSQNTKIEVKDASGRIFGTLDLHSASALAPILDSTKDVRTQARLEVRRKKPNEIPAKPCSDMFRISINLYGPRRLADNIGQYLSQKNLWLGIPNAVEAGITTLNPHAEKRLQAAAAFPAKQQSYQSETRTAEEISGAVSKMFDQLRSAQNLPEEETPELVKTELLAHQKQALWFMMEKEKPRKLGPNEEDNNSLWRIQYKANGQKFYHEIISGVSVPEEPPQVFGGLLADMMGLGKTLSILSLVCSTLPQSIGWTQEKPENEVLLNAKSTLLVSPLSAVGNWVSQIKEHLEENAITYYVFHGPSRTEDPGELAKYDIIITTYSTILSDVSGKSSKRKGSPLLQLGFFRIVLDEAHAIREQNAAQSQAIFQLEAQRRWSVTGTPIQNRLEDLGSVTRFLRLHPYNEKGRFMGHIVSPFKLESPSAIANLRVLVDSFTLRRVKDRINLPPRQNHIIQLSFTQDEQKLHDFFKNESRQMMNVVASDSRDKVSGKMYHIVLKAMMLLRQISAHGKELLDKEDRERFKGSSASDAINVEELENAHSTSAADRKAYEMLALMRDSSADTCGRCGNDITMGDDTTGDKNAMIAAMLPCYDILCPDCFGSVKGSIDDRARDSERIQCLYCNSLISSTYSIMTSAGFEQYQLQARRNRKTAKALGQYEGPHTKTRALISHLITTAEENKRSPGKAPIKSVVFSSWTTHLDLIEIALENNGLQGYVRLDGTMTLKQRNAALGAFATDESITILLATLGAGGVGLNLTSASKVYIMESQYNPAAVAQAVDRVHRLGQTREVTTVQFMMKDSIEERITELAERKQKLADMSLNRKMDRRELQQGRLREYRSLFK